MLHEATTETVGPTGTGFGVGDEAERTTLTPCAFLIAEPVSSSSDVFARFASGPGSAIRGRIVIVVERAIRAGDGRVSARVHGKSVGPNIMRSSVASSHITFCSVTRSRIAHGGVNGGVDA